MGTLRLKWLLVLAILYSLCRSIWIRFQVKTSSSRWFILNFSFWQKVAKLQVKTDILDFFEHFFRWRKYRGWNFRTKPWRVSLAVCSWKRRMLCFYQGLLRWLKFFDNLGLSTFWQLMSFLIGVDFKSCATCNTLSRFPIHLALTLLMIGGTYWSYSTLRATNFQKSRPICPASWPIRSCECEKP